MRPHRYFISLSVCAGALVASAPSAFADEAADTATARALGIDGVALANAGNCKDAIEKLERAEKLHHAPTTATRLAECEIAQGKLIRGTERLQRVIREPLAANAHPAFVAAVARAKEVLDAALPRLATLKIGVDAPRGTALTLSVDDDATSDAILDTPRPVDPGNHVIKVSADGFLPASVSTSIEEGQTKSVLVELKPDPNARRAMASREPAQVAAFPVAVERKGSKLPAVVAFGVGALGLGAGIYGAIVVDDKARTLSNACDANRVCPPELQREIRDAKTWATVSTVGFATAGVGAAAGVILLLVTGNHTDSTKAGARVRPNIGASSIGIDGVF